MNKKDLLPIILLALLIPVWLHIDRQFIAPRFPAPAPAVQPAQEEGPAETASPGAAIPAMQAATAPDGALEEPEPVIDVVEVLHPLENGKVRIELTSLGGGIKSATLLGYPELDEKGSPPVVLDFSSSSALAYEGLKGIRKTDALEAGPSQSTNSVVFQKRWNSGILFQRTITLGDDYLLTVSDRFINQGTSPWNLPALRIPTGRMENPADIKAMKGMSLLGVDSHTPAGGINYWGRKLNSLYKKAGKPSELDTVPEEMVALPVDWVAAKNKFFVQILSPKEPVATMALLSTRDTEQKGMVPRDVAAALDFAPQAVAPGDSYDLDYTYYIGPKQYTILKASGDHMEKVMEFETIGFWSFMNWLMEPSRKALLWTLTFFDGIFRNYGVAIILLTLVVRILFWPLTHKSTESMRRMQELQPEIKALQEKHKKDPQRLQQETMKLYRERKVNPMGGCLPMFVQIPVFIALFTVLRNAIELRYEGFLWIADLSSPENLLAGKVPLVGSLNILPLVMSASMIWQQKMTSPSTAVTPEQQQQQKMMMVMMPVMMLFFFYSMPSGLVLYWTTSNLMMIGQTAIRNLRKKMKEA